MNTKEFKDITQKELFEVTGGYEEKKTTIESIMDKICVQIKELFN